MPEVSGVYYFRLFTV